MSKIIDLKDKNENKLKIKSENVITPIVNGELEKTTYSGNVMVSTLQKIGDIVFLNFETTISSLIPISQDIIKIPEEFVPKKAANLIAFNGKSEVIPCFISPSKRAIVNRKAIEANSTICMTVVYFINN